MKLVSCADFCVGLSLACCRKSTVDEQYIMWSLNYYTYVSLFDIAILMIV